MRKLNKLPFDLGDKVIFMSARLGATYEGHVCTVDMINDEDAVKPFHLGEINEWASADELVSHEELEKLDKEVVQVEPRVDASDDKELTTGEVKKKKSKK